MVDRTVRFIYDADPSGVIRAAKAIDAAHGQMEKGAQKSSAAFLAQAKAAGTVGKNLSLFLTVPLIAGGVAMFNLAKDAEETLNKVRVLFGENADEIEAWSRTAVTSLAMTSAEAQNAASTFAVFAEGAGFAAQDTAAFSMVMTQLATDFASFFNTRPEDAIQAIGAAFRGEFEPIRRYGVVLDVARVTQEAMRLGLIKQGDELNRTARMLATQSLILKDTTLAQGDFARTAGSTANQQRIQAAAAKEQAMAFGKQLIPVGQAAIAMFARMTSFITNLSAGQKAAAVNIGLFAIALGPAISMASKLITIAIRLGQAVRAAAAGQAFLTAAIGGPIAIAALAAGAAAAIGFVVAMNKMIDSASEAAAAANDNAAESARVESAYSQAADVAGVFDRAQVELGDSTKKAKKELSEATKEAARFGEEITSAFESATGASHAFESIVVPALEDSMRAWEDAVATVEDAHRRLMKAMSPATADDLTGAQLDLRDAQIAVTKAAAKLATTLGDSEATALDAEEAQIALTRAELRLRDEEEKLQTTMRRGTDLDADVVEAKGAVEEASNKLNLATRELQHAQAGITPELLLDALREQERGAQQWASSLQALSHAGIDQGILRELARLGPEGLPKVQAFFDFVSVYGSAALNGIVGGTRSALDRAIAVFPEVRPAMEAVARDTMAAVGTAGGAAMAKSMEDQIKISVSDIFATFTDIKGFVAGVPGMFTGSPAGWQLPNTGQVEMLTRRLGRQRGGPVSAGMPYIVGERGPEWFVPGRSGTVMPGAPSTSTVVNVYVQGSVVAERDLAETVQRALVSIDRRGG